jgi:hypothetical protein
VNAKQRGFQIMKQSVRIEAPCSSRRFRFAGTSCRLAALVALAAGTGCQSDPPADPPDAAPDVPPDAAPEAPPDAQPPDFLKPCGVEERFVDGDVLSYDHRAYDEQGNHVLSERDTNRDGMADDRFVWAYAAGGGLTLLEQSFDSGTMHEVAAQYEGEGRLDFVTWTSSSGGEGRADYEYDGEQRILERWDRDNDGVAEAVTTYTYDAGGKLEEHAFACTGAEPATTTTMQWGEGGRIERIERRVQDALSQATQYFYDQDGRLERWERSLGDGTVVASEAYEYGAAGKVKETSTASALVLGGGLFTWSVTDTVYDDFGRALSSQTSLDDQMTTSTVYLYECPDHEDSAGRSVGAPASPLPAPPVGPRGGMGLDAVSAYALAGTSCL